MDVREDDHAAEVPFPLPRQPADARAPRTASRAAAGGYAQAVQHAELFVALLIAVVLVAMAARRARRVPEPVALVVGGIVAGLLPFAPDVRLDPDVIFVVFLPPILYPSAFRFAAEDVRSNARPIAFLAVGLVLATMAAIAVAVHAVAGIPWAAAFALGAVLAPTDPVAATTVIRSSGAPQRLSTILEGESLINDGTALVLYKAAAGAAVGGAFSLLDTSARIVLNVIGGIAIGLAVGWCIRQVRRRIDDPPVEVAIAVLSGYLAFLPAAAAGVSGVLAAVTVGVYMGWYTPELTNERTRLSGDAFWEIFVFLANALVFVLVGLQLRTIVDALSGISTAILSASTTRTRPGSGPRSSPGSGSEAPSRSWPRWRSRSTSPTAS